MADRGQMQQASESPVLKGCGEVLGADGGDPTAVQVGGQAFREVVTARWNLKVEREGTGQAKEGRGGGRVSGRATSPEGGRVQYDGSQGSTGGWGLTWGGQAAGSVVSTLKKAGFGGAQWGACTTFALQEVSLAIGRGGLGAGGAGKGSSRRPGGDGTGPRHGLHRGHRRAGGMWTRPNSGLRGCLDRGQQGVRHAASASRLLTWKTEM